jgi:NHLM bacteriocin system ABC transporter peptidase/ATP-binding protein
MTEPRKSAPSHRRPVRTPTVIQMEAVECGAAAFGIILAYYRHYVPLEILRDVCSVTRDGSNAANIVRAARTYGFNSGGMKLDIGELDSAPLPAILFWNFNHFVVLEGYSGDRFYLNDPASGRRSVYYDEFDKAFTGIVLKMTPGETFVETGGPPSMFSGLIERFRGTESALTFVVLTGLFLVIPGILVPGFSKIFIDNILLGSRREWLGPLLLGMGATMLVGVFLNWLQAHYLLRLHTKLSLSMSAKFLMHVLRLPTNFFQQRFPGDIASRVQSNDRVAALLTGQLAGSCISLVTIVFYAIVMFMFDTTLTLIGIATVFVLLAIVRAFTRLRVDESRRLQQEIGKQYGVLMSGLLTLDTLKASGREGDFVARWSGHQAKSVNSQQQLAVLSLWLGLTPGLLQALLLNAVILGWGGWQVMKGELSIGSLVAMQFLTTSFISPAKNLVNLGQSIQTIQADLARLDDIRKCDPDPMLQVGEHFLPEAVRRLSGRVLVDAVTFGYDRLKKPLITDFRFQLKSGGRVAIVGPSGSGKSTIAKLLAGLYHPWQGVILFDGIPAEKVPRPIRSASLAMVDQQIILFEGSIRDNLTLWDVSIPDEDVVRAAADACILDEIASRPGGLDAKITQMGFNFSGGQRQRLEIARALATNPSILILDEATSALDPQTELAIDRNLRERGCSCIIIAHRLSTIRDADEIIVLKDGNVVERGAHDQLVELGGHYAELVTTT